MMRRDMRQLLNSDHALRSALRRLPRRNAPAEMTTTLRVVASRERERMLRRKSWKERVASWREHAHLKFENVMRPLALPVAGGVFSAAALFSMWVVPTYPVLAASNTDVPTQLSTEARVRGFSAIGHAAGDVLVEVEIDERGQMVDYRIVSPGYEADMTERRHLENLLVFTSYIPATSFGKPKPGKMRMWLSSSSIDVKG